MKKFCINLMMLLAVTLIGICICSSKDVTHENTSVKQEQDKSISILAIGNSCA